MVRPFRLSATSGVAIVAPASPFTRDDEKELTFTGFLLFFDPPKPGVQETIQDLEKLCVHLKIITGDNKLVAQHAAQMVGLEVSRTDPDFHLNRFFLFVANEASLAGSGQMAISGTQHYC
jgi:magnesium-transporting ATPase (P-type)